MSPESGRPTYEPLGLVLLISLLLRRVRHPLQHIPASNSGETGNLQPTLDLGSDSIYPATLELDTATVDIAPNKPLLTYLTKDALSLPERQCSLCFDPRGTSEESSGAVAVTECGHVFCWGCLGGLEKASFSPFYTFCGAADLRAN